MKTQSDKSFIAVDSGFCLFLALLLMTVPLRWVIGWFLAAAVHELCHYLALRYYGINICRITIGCAGAIMETGSMTQFEEIVCSIAGPVGGSLLLLVSKWFPCTAICAFAQSLFNLLPIYPLDGGRAFWTFICWLIGDHIGTKIQTVIEFLLLLIMLIGGIVLFLYFHFGPVPLIVAVLLFVRRDKSKNSLQIS